ncbi:MAG: CsbD family protein [Chloroflexi bacterium]|nr:CsbD family protein [Chloroflexota bacterium]
MNTRSLRGKWKQMRGKVKKQWADVADYDLDKIADKRDDFVKLVQKKYGYTKEKAEDEVDFFLEKMKLRPANDKHVLSTLAVSIGSLLIIAVFLMLIRRLASA